MIIIYSYVLDEFIQNHRIKSFALLHMFWFSVSSESTTPSSNIKQEDFLVIEYKRSGFRIGIVKASDAYWANIRLSEFAIFENIYMVKTSVLVWNVNFKMLTKNLYNLSN